EVHYEDGRVWVDGKWKDADELQAYRDGHSTRTRSRTRGGAQETFQQLRETTDEASSSSSGLSPEERMATIRGVNQLADVLKEAIRRK
ncbi:unnamed protein product, partial [Cladocopium goreaui]